MLYKLVNLLFLLFSFQVCIAQNGILVCTWNLKDFGKTKSETEIDFIANTVKEYDVLAIEEVVAGEGGTQAVARLADALNRKGSKWDYTFSDPTSSSSYKTERYVEILFVQTPLFRLFETPPKNFCMVCIYG